MIKDIVVHLDGTDKDERRLQHADALATLFDARLTVLFTNLIEIGYIAADPVGASVEIVADAIEEAGVSFDLLFGPAYKGIPLATALGMEFARRGRDLPLAFNRKEAKDHGEGGTLIGAPLDERRVLIVDDVITAGTAIREALGLITAAGGVPAGIVVALDRQEILGEDGQRLSAAQRVAAETGVPVIAVASLHDLLAFAGENAELVGHREQLLAYRARYGSAA